MNCYSKMRRSNSKVRRWFEQREYSNIHFFPHTRFIKDVDIDGQGFDGLASDEKRLIIFQVKSNKNCPKEVAEQYKKIATKYGVICIWFNVKDRKGVMSEIFEEIP